MKENSNPGNNQSAQLSQDDAAMRERIEKRAYNLWLAGGGGHGQHLSHWLQAEIEVQKAIQREQEERAAARKSRPAAKPRSSPISNEPILNQ